MLQAWYKDSTKWSGSLKVKHSAQTDHIWVQFLAGLPKDREGENDVQSKVDAAVNVSCWYCHRNDRWSTFKFSCAYLLAIILGDRYGDS